MASTLARPRSESRLVVYYQTTHDPSGNLISILPLITKPGISVTHINVAAIHLNEDPNAMTLNDHAPSDPRYTTMWAELRIAQASGIKVLGMLGGAAKGSYTRLDQDQKTFDAYYGPLYEMVRERSLDGLDLDVEEDMSLAGIVRLIDRLRSDFGPAFVITLTPVATALLDPTRNLSGFDYEALEVMRGSQIAWYNAQFYCGWGDASTPHMYQLCIRKGWQPQKIVLGLVTTPKNGPGWVPPEMLAATLTLLRHQFPNFGGVMGWEYFNSLPGGQERPWEWAQQMTKILSGPLARPSTQAKAVATTQNTRVAEKELDGEDGATIPKSFEYYSDGSSEDESHT
ncbi:glycoside hydrolase family 18 protein [Durotheca rogersii]|uniref:glycoside hydrolase family 18 protein n=1 Tax=Durotheca rogersii TaxID=419775 RepID=UPI00222109AE|nr:glycoside hydrolase family 18 protein [Durotheca rogersii]KAI5867202.1 glycoside hydrolase family 18 protein [Durotheca rogersii]